MSEILVGQVSGGPCKGAKNVIAPSSWDGRVQGYEGRYVWNTKKQKWVWWLDHFQEQAPKPKPLNIKFE